MAVGPQRFENVTSLMTLAKHLMSTSALNSQHDVTCHAGLIVTLSVLRKNVMGDRPSAGPVRPDEIRNRHGYP
jgi:hypothetical protein